jgi:ubiquitin-conjugating enzyme E2 J2
MSQQQKECIRRLQREYQAIIRDPPPNILATPNPSNILEWHFVFFGPKDTPYSGGVYHGKLRFPEEYPHKPPSIMMITPSGRFVPNKRLCFTMSDYHPELWNPMWSVSSILMGLLSFMIDRYDFLVVGSFDNNRKYRDNRRREEKIRSNVNAL